MEAGCHGGVVTGFFVDTSGESPTCADKRTERVGLGRSRTRPNPTAQLSLGAGIRTSPHFFSISSAKRGRSIGAGGHLAGPSQFPVSAPLSGASRSWVGVPGVRRSGRLKAIPTRREEPRFTASAFFLGLTGRRSRLLVAPSPTGATERRTNLPAARLPERPATLLHQPAGFSFHGQPTFSPSHC